MLIEEARWLKSALARLAADRLSPLLNLGSSSAEFRERTQPWIHDLVLAPLEERGVRVIHCDLKSQPGVDIVADVLDDDGYRRLRELNPRSILLSNVLEHLEDRRRFASRCELLVGDGGYLIVTVPRSYPYHADPIDTLYRPDPDQLAEEFRELTAAERHVVTTQPDYSARVKKDLIQPLRDIAQLPVLWWRFGSMRMSRFVWMRRPYETTCCVFVREGSR